MGDLRQQADVQRPPDRSALWLAAAVVVLAATIGGAALAVLTSGEGPGSHPAAAATLPEPTTVTAASTPTVTNERRSSTAESSTDVRVASPPRSDMTDADRSEVQQLLTAYYRDVVAGDQDAAWALLSPSYKTWKAQNGGRARWSLQEDTNRRYLQDATPVVRIVAFDPDTDVATLRVRGMTYDEPGHGTCPYVGVTWARRYGTTWRYDQGYLQRADRAATWRPRRAETLGYPCQDGY